MVVFMDSKYAETRNPARRKSDEFHGLKNFHRTVQLQLPDRHPL